MEEELNRKIAEWVGFEFLKTGEDEEWVFKPAPQYDENISIIGSRWITPDGTLVAVHSKEGK